MKWPLLLALACPRCHSPLQVDGDVAAAILNCASCGLTAPLLRGLLLFGEARLAPERWRSADLPVLDFELFGPPEQYERFLRSKRLRPAHDLYAAFHPFNEATRSWLPLLPIIRRHVPAGSLILDLWCRTGWTGEWLAGLFPDCRIVAVWEGNSDTLGYRGFAHWLGTGKRAANLELLFCDINQGLPFADASAGFVFCMDALHRYQFPHFPRQVMRVASPQAPIVFAHTHLTNGKPDPFFERGETQRSGQFYQDFFADEQGLGPRDVYVLPELGMFVGETTRLTTDPESRHYNGMVALLPMSDRGAELVNARLQKPLQPEQRLLFHPLVEADLTQGWLRLNDAALNDGVAHMLFRHPIQRSLLQTALPYRLSAWQCQTLYWARLGLTAGQIAARLNLDWPLLANELQPLCEHDFLQAVDVSEAMLRLQTYYSDQVAEPPWHEQTLPQLWAGALANHPNHLYLLDNSSGEHYSYRDAEQIIVNIVAALTASDLKRNDAIAVYSQPNIEAFLLFWAAMRLGLVFAPIDPARDASYVQTAVAQIQAKLVFTERPRQLATTSATVYFDDAEPANGDNMFSDWLEQSAAKTTAAALPPPAADDPAVVLFTSGTTGAPKGVRLSHASLFRSSRSLADTLQLTAADRLLCPAPMHAISSLRNPLIATVQAGAAAIVSNSEQLASPLAVAAAVETHGVTVLSTAPALLERWLDMQDRIPPEQVRSLRALWTTAFRLRPATALVLAKRYNCHVFDYYGLTESGGICAWRDIADDSRANSIGKPLDVVAQIVDEAGQVLAAGQRGELRLAGANLMLGYVGNANNGLQVREGWLYTGDLAEWDADGRILLLGRKRMIVKLKSGDVLSLSDVTEYLRHKLGRNCRLASCWTNERYETYVVFVAGHAMLTATTIADSIETVFGKTAAPAAVFFTNGDHQLEDAEWQRRCLKQASLHLLPPITESI